MNLLVQWTQLFDHRIHLLLEGFIFVCLQPVLGARRVIVQPCRFTIQIDIGLEIVSRRGTGRIVPLLPIVFQLLRVTAVGQYLRQLRFQCQIALGGIVVVAHLHLGIVFLHRVNSIEHTAELILWQCGIS
uniref:Putative membrane protein n=1 Tax=Anopheles darlingi TaxID=43151 RepID=A0A2M4D017_ANODA